MRGFGRVEVDDADISLDDDSSGEAESHASDDQSPGGSERMLSGFSEGEGSLRGCNRAGSRKNASGPSLGAQNGVKMLHERFEGLRKETHKVYRRRPGRRHVHHADEATSTRTSECGTFLSEHRTLSDFPHAHPPPGDSVVGSTGSPLDTAANANQGREGETERGGQEWDWLSRGVGTLLSSSEEGGQRGVEARADGPGRGGSQLAEAGAESVPAQLTRDPSFEDWGLSAEEVAVEGGELGARDKEQRDGEWGRLSISRFRLSGCSNGPLTRSSQ